MIFDVGGNKGDYTKLASGILKGRPVKIFIFEPSQKLYGMLNREFGGNSTVKVYRFALSDSKGAAVLFFDQEGSGLASLAQRDLNHLGAKLDLQEKVETITLDNFCSSEGISEIDFLKLDIEGFEYSALLGAKNFLANKKSNFFNLNSAVPT